MDHYEGSTKKALAPENVKVPVDTPEQRGKIVGSSAILSHLMITRYVTIIDELKILISSEEYMKNEGRKNKLVKINLNIMFYFLL